MKRVRNKTRPEIGKVQFGFLEHTGARNAIFMQRMILERAIVIQKDLFVCFIDYTKAFDKVQHNELFNLPQNLDLNGKDLRIKEHACV